MSRIVYSLKSKKFWKRFIVLLTLTPIILFLGVVAVVYAKQDVIVQELLKTTNEGFVGQIKIKDSHVAPFANFPYISIDIEGLEVFENKIIAFDTSNKNNRIVYINDAYIGFGLFDILSGKYDVKAIRLSEGNFNLVQDSLGGLNITKAFESKKTTDEINEALHLDLKSIRLDNIDLTKFNEENKVLIDAFFRQAKLSFKTNDKQMAISVASKFELSILKNGDSTFVKRKPFSFDSGIALNKISQLLKINDSDVFIEESSFGFGGTIDLKNDANVNLKFYGRKPNFDLFIALAPEELIPTLKQFDNQGQIFFDVAIKGPTLNGKQPAINASFGCENGFFNNLNSKKKLNKIGFRGSFTNGKKRDLSTMRFALENFSARPDAGTFKGKILVENFLEPEIDMNLVSDFDLDFLAKFINSRELAGLSGKVILTMNFHDIIDLSAPEKSIEKLNQSYFTKLEIRKLCFKSDYYHLPLNNLDLKAQMVGNRAQIDRIQLKVGESDLLISGSISDLPALIHHSPNPITTDLSLQSKFLNVKELTSNPKKGNKGVDEEIEDLRFRLRFLSTAKELSEFKNLPLGEFFIEDLHAKMKNYPHKLHDFHADLFVDENDFRVVDFSGMIDNSDFHFSGRLDNYAIWFEKELKGDTKIEFDLTSKLLQFDNIFTYGGERFVPEDYRNEEISGLKLHGITDLHFYNGLQSTDFQLTKLEGKLKVHPLKFENFSGRAHLENKFLTVDKFKGKLGNSVFDVDLKYNLSEQEEQKKNYLAVCSSRLDVDELMNYTAPKASADGSAKPTDHDAVFSIYDFDFPKMEVITVIGELNYHDYTLKNLKSSITSEAYHLLNVKQLDFDVAGGHFSISGYLSGKDKRNIYFKPNIVVENVDLDKFMVKFDNFGQDQLVSENLHGKFSGKISGKIRMHADLVPIIQDSELSIDLEVLKGRLENYGPVLALSDYFEDAKLKSIHFDTLKNTFTLKNSVLTIPKMTISTNLGFLELSGAQKITDKMDMDYNVGVLWKMISQAAGRKLFQRSKASEESPQEIQYKNENARLVFVKISGDLENYKVKLIRRPK